MRVLLTGAGGMLGSAFAESLVHDELVAVGRECLDIRYSRLIRQKILDASPDVVLNCAAHTDVEGAEHDPDTCYAANAVLPGILGAACRAAAAKLVHFSSTGCYGAWKSTPYIDLDPLQPTTTHHRAKLAGEDAIRSSGCEHLILRTGWLFGGNRSHKNNFVWRRIIEAGDREHMTSDASQRGNPTYTHDVVAQTLKLIEVDLRGTFNLTANGSASRYEYVARIVTAAKLPCKVEPGPPFKRVAPVSSNEVGRNYKLQLLGLDTMPEWEVSVDRYVHELLNS